jgi:hypothetical protein
MSLPRSVLAQTGEPELNDLIANQASVLGQLVAMSTFRDFRPLSTTANQAGRSGMESAARRLHQGILDGWLNLSMLEQKRDVAAYLSEIGSDPAALAGLVARAPELTPEGSMPAQRDLFIHELAIIYLMLAHEWNSEPANRVRPIAAKGAEQSADPPPKEVIAA